MDDEIQRLIEIRSIKLDRLYEPPFTTLHAESVDGICKDKEDVDDLLAILSVFESKRVSA